MFKRVLLASSSLLLLVGFATPDRVAYAQASFADGRIQDTGALTRKRMETVDEEFLAAAKSFVDRNAKANTPFFVWFNSTRMHVFTHLKPASVGKSGVGLQGDGMLETTTKGK